MPRSHAVSTSGSKNNGKEATRMPCVIPRKHISRTPAATTCVVRVGAERYQLICDLSDASGRSITDVANRLLDYALDGAVVRDEKEAKR